MNINGLIDCLNMVWFIDTFLRLHNINLLIAPLIGVLQRKPQIEEKKNNKTNQPNKQKTTHHHQNLWKVKMLFSA